MSEGELILYTTEDGLTEIQLRAVDGTAWLTQRQMAELFDKDIRTINEHIGTLFEDGECDPAATIRKFRRVQQEGKREVSREVDAYNLDVILSVGYRVRSPRGVQFRRWATTVLRDYLVKGFAVNDARLKNPAADFRARRRQTMRLAEWEPILDNVLAGNERPILRNAGTVSARQAEQIAHQHYATFDLARKEADRAAAEQVDELEELQRIAETSAISGKGKN